MPRLFQRENPAPQVAFTEPAMSPGQAAQAAAVTYATARRYYDRWEDEIKRSLESRLVPSIEESIKRLAKKRKLAKPLARARVKR
jgi:hypothetical protein